MAQKNAAAVELGRLGGRVGGKAKVPKGISFLSPEARRALAMKGVAARKKKAGKRSRASAKTQEVRA